MNTYPLKNLSIVENLRDGSDEQNKIKFVLDRYSNRIKKRCVVGGDKCDVEFYIFNVEEYAGENGSEYSDFVIEKCEVTSGLELTPEEVRAYAEQTIREAYASIGSDLFIPEYE